VPSSQWIAHLLVIAASTIRLQPEQGVERRGKCKRKVGLNQRSKTTPLSSDQGLKEWKRISQSKTWKREEKGRGFKSTEMILGGLGTKRERDLFSRMKGEYAS